MSGDLIHRATLEALLGHRGRALDLAAQAQALYRQQQEALNTLLRETSEAAGAAACGKGTIYKLKEYVEDKYDDAVRHGMFRRPALSAPVWRT